MGLLDDAIRDHLELKRLWGADPGEVAHEQHEALDSVFADEHAAGEEDLPAAPESLHADTNHKATPVAATSAEDPLSIPPPARTADLSDVGQETAELDMRTVLDEHGDAPAIAASPGADPSAGDRDEDSLEWEAPGQPSSESPTEAGHHNQAVGGTGP
jgi:hypothetical protein